MKHIRFFIILGWVAGLSACSTDGLHFDFTIDDVQKAFTHESAPAQPVPASQDTITVASFNIQVFGMAKANNPEVMKVLAKIIHQFDIVAIQEIRDKSGTAIEVLEAEVDNLGEDYDFIIGPRLGRTSSTEQYAYMYRVRKMYVSGSYTYNDSEDLFHRAPFIAHFTLTGGNFDFVLIQIYTDPDKATREINGLSIVMQDALRNYSGEEDLIILGDLNADCNYFDENSDNSFRGDRYKWVISNDMDTTIVKSSCTYDRIIIKSITALEDWTGKAGVYRFDQIYNLTPKQAKRVSDHYPVWAAFYKNRDTD